jgi:hypothetical protein
MGLIALAQPACSDDSKGEDGARGGGSGRGGYGGDGGNGAVGRDGGAGAGGEPLCPSRPLSSWCSGDCPTSPDEFHSDKCGFEAVTRFASACGGVVIDVGTDWYDTAYTFDAGNHLVGVEYSDDVLRDCPDAAGTPCAASGLGEVICEGTYEQEETGGAGRGGQGGVGGQGPLGTGGAGTGGADTGGAGGAG